MWLVLLHFQRRSQFDQYGALEGTPGKPPKNAPSLRQKPEILRSIQGALRSACRTVGRPSRLARAAPPLRGSGLDRLPTARRISRQAPSVEKRTGAFVFLTGGQDITPRVLWRRDRPFRARPVCAMLPECLNAATPGVTVPPPANCPRICTSRPIHGRAAAGPSNMTLKPGA